MQSHIVGGLKSEDEMASAAAHGVGPHPLRLAGRPPARSGVAGQRDQRNVVDHYRYWKATRSSLIVRRGIRCRLPFRTGNTTSTSAR